MTASRTTRRQTKTILSRRLRRFLPLLRRRRVRRSTFSKSSSARRPRPGGGGGGGGVTSPPSDFRRIDRSVQTDGRAEPVRPEVGIASDASREHPGLAQALVGAQAEL